MSSNFHVKTLSRASLPKLNGLNSWRRGGGGRIVCCGYRLPLGDDSLIDSETYVKSFPVLLNPSYKSTSPLKNGRKNSS